MRLLMAGTLRATATIRPVKEDELDQLVSLCQAHAQFEGADYTTKGKLAALEYQLFRETPFLQCLVVTVEDTLVGYATFMKQFSTWEAQSYLYMDCLYLHSTARNQGLGKKLLEQVVDYAKIEQCTELQWQTPAQNERAIKFYLREGASVKTKARCFLPLSMQ